MPKTPEDSIPIFKITTYTQYESEVLLKMNHLNLILKILISQILYNLLCAPRSLIFRLHSVVGKVNVWLLADCVNTLGGKRKKGYGDELWVYYYSRRNY